MNLNELKYLIIGSCWLDTQDLINDDCSFVFCLPQLKATCYLSTKDIIIPCKGYQSVPLPWCTATAIYWWYCSDLRPLFPPASGPCILTTLSQNIRAVQPVPTNHKMYFWIDLLCSGQGEQAHCVSLYKEFKWTYFILSQDGAAVIVGGRTTSMQMIISSAAREYKHTCFVNLEDNALNYINLPLISQ